MLICVITVMVQKTLPCSVMSWRYINFKAPNFSIPCWETRVYSAPYSASLDFWSDSMRTLSTSPFAEPCQCIHRLLPPVHVHPTNEPSHWKNFDVRILTNSVGSVNPHDISGKNINPNLILQSTFPFKLERRKRVAWDGWTLLQDAHISAIHTDEAVIQTATIFPAFENNLEVIKWVKFWKM